MVREGRPEETAWVRRRFARLSVLPFILLPLVAGGCRSDKGQAEYLYSEARVVSVDVELIATLPGGVNAIVEGTVPEACAELDQIRQEYIETSQTFVITLTTRRPVDTPCVQEETTFTATVPLAIERLPDGVYTVVANGVTATFRLDRDALAPIR